MSILAHQPFVFNTPVVHCIFPYIWMWTHHVHLCTQNIEWITRSAWIDVFISSINLKKKPHTHSEHNWCRQGWLVLKEISRTSEKLPSTQALKTKTRPTKINSGFLPSLCCNSGPPQTFYYFGHIIRTSFFWLLTPLYDVCICFLKQPLMGFHYLFSPSIHLCPLHFPFTAIRQLPSSHE